MYLTIPGDTWRHLHHAFPPLAAPSNRALVDQTVSLVLRVPQLIEPGRRAAFMRDLLHGAMELLLGESSQGVPLML